MATGGFKSNAATDFLEEWKAKREKMRAKMLGDIAASTGAPLAATSNSGSQERGLPSGNCLPSTQLLARSSSASALKRPEEEAPQPHHHSTAAAATAAPTPGSNLKKGLPPPSPQPERAPESSSPPPPASPPPPQLPAVCKDSDSPSQSPSPGKAKEKNSSGPSARKGKGQIEKRKLREKRRSTGVVSIPSNEVSPRAAHLRPPRLVVVGFVVLFVLNSHFHTPPRGLWFGCQSLSTTLKAMLLLFCCCCLSPVYWDGHCIVMNFSSPSTQLFAYKHALL